MILDDFRRALGQLGDPRFRRVLLLGLGLTIALLVALSIAAGWLVGWLVPDTLTLPWIGQVGFLDPLHLEVGEIQDVRGRQACRCSHE